MNLQSYVILALVLAAGIAGAICARKGKKPGCCGDCCGCMGCKKHGSLHRTIVPPANDRGEQ